MKNSGFISFGTAELIWNQSKPADGSNKILENHGLQGFGVRESIRDGRIMLIAPLIDQKGEIRNFLRIFHDLSVSLMTEHPPDHLYHEIGVSGEKTVIVKGYESASLIHELTGWHVLMTYCSESLMKVAVRLRADFRDRAILVAGELPFEPDSGNIPDPARSAAAEAGAELVVPDFSGSFRGKSDMNFHHLSVSKGRRYVTELLRNPEKPPFLQELSGATEKQGGKSEREDPGVVKRSAGGNQIPKP